MGEIIPFPKKQYNQIDQDMSRSATESVEKARIAFLESARNSAIDTKSLEIGPILMNRIVTADRGSFKAVKLHVEDKPEGTQ